MNLPNKGKLVNIQNAHYKYAAHVDKMQKGLTLELRHDTNNKNHADAVGVWIDGDMIGHTDRTSGDILAPRLRAGEKIHAVLTGAPLSDKDKLLPIAFREGPCPTGEEKTPTPKRSTARKRPSFDINTWI